MVISSKELVCRGGALAKAQEDLSFNYKWKIHMSVERGLTTVSRLHCDIQCLEDWIEELNMVIMTLESIKHH